MTTRWKDRTPLQKLLEWRTKGRVFVPNARQSWCRDPLTKRLSCWAWWPTYSGSNAYAKMIRLIFAASCPRAKWYITVISWTVTNNSRIIRKRYCVNIIIMIFADGNDHELKAYYYNDYKYCCNRSPAKENAKKLSSYAPATASSIVTYIRGKIDELSRITPEHSSYLKRYPKCDVYIYTYVCVYVCIVYFYNTLFDTGCTRHTENNDDSTMFVHCRCINRFIYSQYPTKIFYRPHNNIVMGVMQILLIQCLKTANPHGTLMQI